MTKDGLSTSGPSPSAGHRELGPLAFLALAIGGQIGVGWITFVGFWLGDAGARDTLAGFAVGAVMMAGVAACHAELAGMMPVSGGEIVYAERVFGRFAAFLVGWFLLFIAVAMLSFEAVSLGWMLETLFPILRAPPLFSVLGAGVTAPELIISQASLWLVYAVNRRGLHASARTGEFLTAAKVAIVLCLIVGGLLFGQPGRALELPSGRSGQGELWRVLGIVAASPFWIGGFSSIAKLVGERNSTLSMRTVGRLMVATVIASALIYMGIVGACAAAAPVAETIGAPLPAVFAADALFGGGWAGRAILVAGIAGILSIMNAVLLSSSRVMRVFRAFNADVDANRTARGSHDFLLIVAAAALCSVAGRGALAPLNNAGAMAAIICYFVMCLATLRLRIKEPGAERPFRTPGGAPMLVAILVAMGSAGGYLLAQPLLGASKAPPMEWIVFGSWIGLGALAWRILGAKRVGEGPSARRAPEQ
ncbi:APC family permease [Caulobacter sp. KR2-114]|uniref:APC family permease n=1 Tax=Caulobacter sp. KR2-114 TaxID=3400912 RepID=UPI003C011258